MDQSQAVAGYWDRYVGSHINSPDHWEANQVVQQWQWRCISGDPSKNPIDWFLDTYGPFGSMASICSGSGVLELHVGSRCLHTGGIISGYDISPGSIEVARERCAHLPNVSFQVLDANTEELGTQRFDAIFAHGALHHIERLDNCLGSLRAALKPGGYLYVNDYVGPSRFQWADVQLRLARELFELIPPRYRRNADVKRCDPVALSELDPSEAVRSDQIMVHIKAHFRVIKHFDRGGTLLAPIFGSGCIDPSIFENSEGMALIDELCRRERELIDDGLLESDHVVVVARPR